MKKKMRGWAVVACAVLLVFGSAVGTLAYLSSQTETVKNTFTVGQVKITLDETKVDTSGKPICPAQRVTQNTYHLMPDTTYTKDPTIHLAKDSVASWVFIEVKNEIQSIEPVGQDSIAQQILANGWQELASTDSGMWKSATIYYQKAAANHTESAVDLKVFDHFQVRADVADFAAFNGSEVVTVTGYAIQQDDSYTTADEAWQILREQIPAQSTN